jgi:hypothetical protein
MTSTGFLPAARQQIRAIAAGNPSSSNGPTKIKVAMSEI